MVCIVITFDDPQHHFKYHHIHVFFSIKNRKFDAKVPSFEGRIKRFILASNDAACRSQ